MQPGGKKIGRKDLHNLRILNKIMKSLGKEEPEGPQGRPKERERFALVLMPCKHFSVRLHAKRKKGKNERISKSGGEVEQSPMANTNKRLPDAVGCFKLLKVVPFSIHFSFIL